MPSYRNSYFFRRIALLLMVAMLLWTLVTSLLFASISRPRFVKSRGEELLPLAEWIATSASSSFYDSRLSIDQLVVASYQFFETWTVVYRDGIPYSWTPLPESYAPENQESILRECFKVYSGMMRRAIVEEQDQETLTGTFRIPGFAGELLYAAVNVYPPIAGSTEKLRNERNGSPVGTVILVKPLTEFNLGLRALNLSLFLSGLIVVVLCSLPVLYLAKRVMRPLGRIRQVANAITRGDFSQRVPIERERDDEVSDLSRAINHMSSSLAQTLSQLSLERNQLKEVMEGIAEGLIAVDPEGKVSLINEKVWELFNMNDRLYTAEDLLEMTGLAPLFDRSYNEGRSVVEVLHLEAEKKEIYCGIDPIRDDGGEIRTVVGLFRDVTASARLEQTRRDYIANVSHELRTPITAMRALLEPLRDKMVKKEEDRLRYYDIMLRETLRLSRLIDDMLELSRLQSGKTAVKQGPVDIQALADELRENFAFLSEDKKIRFQAEFPETSLPMVWGNEDRIEQILLIYMDNALKFTPTGGLIRFIIEKEPDEMLLTIADNGKGIAPEDIPFVFERFYKADKAHNEKGTGLGLSITKAIADLLHMNVSVRSELGQGSAFSLGIRYADAVMRASTQIKDVFDIEENEHEDSAEEDRTHA